MATPRPRCGYDSAAVLLRRFVASRTAPTALGVPLPEALDESVLLRAVAAGNAAAFTTAYHRYAVRLRLAAWRMSRRGDWLDDLANETWRRAFEARTAYDPARPFLVWLIGILRNVFREQCRNAGVVGGGAERDDPGSAGRSDPLDPARIAAEAEMLAALNECVAGLSPADQDLVRWRFFEGQALRAVAQRMGVAEATLREVRLPAVCGRLRACLKVRGIALDDFFAAHGGDELQYLLGERD